MGNSESADFQKGLTAYRSNDYATALREWEPLAEQGDAFAQYNLGVMYANGDGVPQDDKIALKWFTLAAEQGHAGAKTNLSILQKEMAKTKNSPTVTAKKPSTKRNEVPSIKHRISVLESMKACQVSLSNPKCNLDILDPQFKSTITKLHNSRERLQKLQGSRSTIKSTDSSNSSSGCYNSSITKPTPFMGNNGEVFVLSDRSVWEVKYEYEYLYEYYPSVTICPANNLLIIDGKKLNVQNLSGGTSPGGAELIESNISGSWEGWQGDTIVKLVNGQIWEQVGSALSLSLGIGNDVLIFKKGGMYHMQVEDEDDAVAVRRLK